MKSTTTNEYSIGRLSAKIPPEASGIRAVKTGLYPLSVTKHRDTLIYVPARYAEKYQYPLAVMLHGAGGNAEHGISILKDYADVYDLILIAPASRQQSWDVISVDRFGDDVETIDIALKKVFNRLNIDRQKIAIGGFSDGASYALCIGLTNGDLFSHVLAFSPGFAHTIVRAGNPAIFISHGKHDEVLPIHSCSRKIASRLKNEGLRLRYQEFDGRHEVPDHTTDAALALFLGGD